MVLEQMEIHLRPVHRKATTAQVP
jgi:hypothetical protein